ncbi:predicted protein [Ostreococcus lucimarinus CCE9901]|uniref:DNA polymerase delta subunit 4 n=1 Tax=Ostreococcus lucimarinus (strain CCE9901) TaxID=436017 RepID=A4S099_OSTLU|nr:predicted protein [Ostreococcus lucimarinus CCE9901]ABO97000.1 predicted protein [Ostreococcus lucimarinus CCE9901]|eukprot:XP_001418707.1 predicted protein [Ostreococcus lucimarinus CCE9901]
MPPRSARRPPSATTIDALFRSTKPGAARPGKTKGANVAIEDDDAETIDDDDAVERDARELKTFDLTSKFGPCCGLTRIERWDRARALGLDPPKRVLEILHRRGEASARWRECVWHGRV